MGNPFVHIELATSDIGAAKGFYKKLFDWKLQDTPMGEGMVYTMLGVGKGTGGGMMQAHGPQPTAWLPYVEVADVRKTLEKARAGGATIVIDRKEIGENMGAFGVLIDPQGAALGLWEAAKKAPAKRSAAKKTAKTAATKPSKKAAKKKGKR